MELSNLSKLKGTKRKAKIIGRGIGSGKGGHTVGRGNKGQKARKGAKPNLGFEGGQVPLYKRLPQLGGFTNPTSKFYSEINLGMLNAIKTGTEVTSAYLKEHGFIKHFAKNGVKVLGKGSIKKKLVFVGLKFSDSAKEKALKAGCTVK